MGSLQREVKREMECEREKGGRDEGETIQTSQ